MLPPGGRVLVALSGGPDSVALLHILRTLERRGAARRRRRRPISIISCAAPRRTPTRRSAASWRPSLGLPIRGRARATCAALARETAAARSRMRRGGARYAFLNGAAASLDAGAIAVGHSLDDQAETFLLRLIRGAGPAGLAGIRPRAGTRDPAAARDSAGRAARLRRRATGCEFREDSSNADLAIPRNRVRLELLPHLRAVLAGDCRDPGPRGGAGARTDEEFLEAAAIEWTAIRSSYRKSDGVAVDAPALAASPRLSPPAWPGSSCGGCARPVHRFSAHRRFAGARPSGRTGRRSHCRAWWRRGGGPDRARRRPAGAVFELFSVSVVYSR